MGEIARMSRSQRFIKVMQDRLDRGNVGKVFRLTGMNYGLDESEGHAVAVIGQLVEVDRLGRKLRGGEELEVQMEMGHVFDPDWSNKGDFAEFCERFGMTEEQVAEAWKEVNGGS